MTQVQPTEPLVIEVPVLRQDSGQSCIQSRGMDFALVFMIFLLDFGAVWYFN